jgi:restriction endonuclease S subunit
MNVVMLDSICEICLGYAFRGKILPEDNGVISVIQPKNILSGDFSDLVKVSDETVRRKHCLNKNSILITNRGVFKSCVFNSFKNTVASGGIFIPSVKDDSNILPEYISAYLNSLEGQKQLFSLQETMTIAAITLKTLKQIEIPVIPLEKQKKLSEVVKLYERKTTLLKELLNLETQRINETIKGVING